MKLINFIVTWRYKNQGAINKEVICAKNLDAAEKIAIKRFSSSKRDWIDIILSDKTKGIPEY